MSLRNTEVIDLIINTIEPDLFRYIVVKYDIFPAVRELKNILAEKVLQQKIIYLSVLENGYEAFIQKLYCLQNEIVIVVDFDLLLENDTWRMAFNQQRDKLSLHHKVNLLACIPNEQKYVELCMKGMADFWSIRHLSVEVEVDFVAKNIDFEMFKPSFRDWHKGLSAQEIKENQEEIERINKRLKELNPQINNHFIYNFVQKYFPYWVAPRYIVELPNMENIKLIAVLFLQKLNILVKMKKYKSIILEENKINNMVKTFFDEQKYYDWIVSVCDILAEAFNRRNQYDKAISFAEKGTSLLEKGDEGFNDEYYYLQESIAYSYLKKGDFDKSLVYYQKAGNYYSYAKRYDPRDFFFTSLRFWLGIFTSCGKAVVYLCKKDYKNAKKYFMLSLELSDTPGYTNNHHFPYYHLALYHYTLQDPIHTQYYLDKAAETLPQDHPNYPLITQLSEKIQEIFL